MLSAVMLLRRARSMQWRYCDAQTKCVSAMLNNPKINGRHRLVSHQRFSAPSTPGAQLQRPVPRYLLHPRSRGPVLRRRLLRRPRRPVPARTSAAPAAAKAISRADVEAILAKLADEQDEDYDWKRSIVEAPESSWRRARGHIIHGRGHAEEAVKAHTEEHGKK
jgi:hypothetical protein